MLTTFSVQNIPGLDPEIRVLLSLVIWTTTPWSLAANRAICYKPDAEYAIVVQETPTKAKDHHHHHLFIVAKDILEQSQELTQIFGGGGGAESIRVLKTVQGKRAEADFLTIQKLSHYNV